MSRISRAPDNIKIHHISDDLRRGAPVTEHVRFSNQIGLHAHWSTLLHHY